MKKVILFVFVLIISAKFSFSQKTVANGWHLLNYQQDSVYGIDLNRAYAFLLEKNKKATPVIVAVIDSGIDTAHEDLKNILWKNTKEIPGNGIDDDKNGYIDDIYGWNFLGNKDGRNIKKASSEKSRIFHTYKNKYENKELDTNLLSKDEKYIYKTWLRSAAEINASTQEQANITYIELALKSLIKNDKIVREDMGKEEYTFEELEIYIPKTNDAKRAKVGVLQIIKLFSLDSKSKNTEVIEEISEYVEGKKASFEEAEKAPFDYRADIVKDNTKDINDKNYGNNDVMASTPKHGTHVSGIIAAQRNNNLGMDGVADNVKIMTIRAVPDGDEYDKDVALAIFYAVDNGAKVINMSFGKGFSPEKKWVDSAVQYAASKDVIILHAAGNDSKNIDSSENFPNPFMYYTGKRAPNYVTVGASSDPKISGSLAASFSNYGINTVDVFAPGDKIYSTIPGGNKYGNLQGTSMATPVVAGIAALLRSYYPSLSAVQIKNIIEKSATIYDNSVATFLPGTNDKTTLSELCRTGGLVNAYAAVQLAEKTVPEVNKVEENKLPIKPTKKVKKKN
ncbi:MAG TPA: S8 family peptidase [Chitinophagaceae bacterium]|nr:S8 family peptidase [Chitinophagaceae bacterium]MCC6635304.1 S8 family peptidase [Chitinophagaceae bacterium]HMZ46032.1 S8 family peptidase [Chitinophagaceae bacterium]HNF29339.1 S8 family peptidase [Chitinophagaceae bacterium]HNM33877.1 S8 family peptidase [Chitinophagaceae bacterium]